MSDNVQTIIGAKKKIMVSMYLTVIVFICSSFNYFEEINKRMDDGILSNGLSVEGFMLLPISMIFLFSLQFSILISLSKAKINLSKEKEKEAQEVDLTNF